MSLLRPYVDNIIIENNSLMVETICVRGPTLAPLAIVSVWQRAVNRQPGSRGGSSPSQEPLFTVIPPRATRSIAIFGDPARCAGGEWRPQS